MITVISLVALSTLVADFSRQPSWQSDYQAALAQGARQNKPLAVFLAPGKSGWDKLSHEGTLGKEVQQLLETKYVPVYLNTDTVQGKELASSFELRGGIGLVLSDREGQRQAFWHEGALAEAELARVLERHAEPNGPLLTTETNSAAPIIMEPTYRYQSAYSPICSH